LSRGFGTIFNELSKIISQLYNKVVYPSPGVLCHWIWIVGCPPYNRRIPPYDAPCVAIHAVSRRIRVSPRRILAVSAVLLCASPYPVMRPAVIDFVFFVVKKSAIKLGVIKSVRVTLDKSHLGCYNVC